MSKPKTAITIKAGNKTFQVVTAKDAANAINILLDQFLQTITLCGANGKIGNLAAKDIMYWTPNSYNKLRCKKLVQFIKYNKSSNYKPLFFRTVFQVLAQVANSNGLFKLRQASFISSHLEKLSQAGYISYTSATAQIPATKWRTSRATTYHFFTATPKGICLINEGRALPSKKINPDTDFWYVALQYLIAPSFGDNSIESGGWVSRSDSGATLPPVFSALQACEMLAPQMPQNSKLVSLYSKRIPGVAQEMHYYFVPKVEEALLRKITRVVQEMVRPRWDRDYKNRKRTLRPPSVLDKELVNLVPTREHSILLGKGNKDGAYYKMLLENTFQPRVENY